MQLIGLHDLAVLVLAALGVSFVVTRSEIFFVPRLAWCFTFRWLYRRIGKVLSPWSPVMCPHCNVWWTGGGLALLSGHGWFQVLQVAFISCGVMAFLQQALGGDIAPADDMEGILLGEDVAPTDDMEEILEVQNGRES